jgi:glycosidase
MHPMRLTVPLLFALAAALPEAGCVAIPDDARPRPIGTHVADWRDEVIYQVLVDRFANGDVNNDFRVQPGYLARYQGGDWKGMEERLDYFVELGVTTLWISPVVKNVETDADVDSYHGYWAQDLRQVNPHFGDVAELRSLVARAHAKGLKVVLDIVTNHMGQVFYYDINLNGHPDIYIGGSGTKSQVTRTTEYDPDFDPRGVQAFTSLGEAGRAPVIFINDPSINRVPPAGVLGTAGAYHGFGRTLDYAKKDQLLLGDFPGGLKDVATELPEVRREMIDAYTSWVEKVDLDGFRIDTVKHVENEFWLEFAPAVRRRLAAKGKRNFLMFGEAFDGDDKLLGSFTQPGMLDSVFYFSQYYEVIDRIFMRSHTDKYDVDQNAGGVGSTKQIQDLWERRKTNWSAQPQEGGIGLPPQKFPVNFLDNHDVARFLFNAEGDKEALRNALTYLYTAEGIPCLYYGTEQEFAGGNDPANREVLWNTGFATGGDTFQHLRKLARLRKAYPALRKGDVTVRYATDHRLEEEDAGVFAFERAGGDAGEGYALVILNTKCSLATCKGKKTSNTADGTNVMKVGAAPGTGLVDVLNPDRQQFAVAPDGTLRVTVPAQRAMVLVPQAQVKP